MRIEFEADESGLRWNQQCRVYRPCKERWWCGCESFRKSAYHICKHLIRLYVGDEGMRSNKPPMPAFGEVYRQSRFPILWLKGIHSAEQLTEHDLQPDTIPAPIANPTSAIGSENALGDEIDIEAETLAIEEQLTEIYESEEEYEAFSEAESESDEEEERDEGFGNMFDSDFGGSEAEELEWEREMEGDEIKEQAQLLCEDLRLVVRELEDLVRYPSGHPHLREIPRLQPGNMTTLIAWAKRRVAIDNASTFPRTWGVARHGNVFK
jgi:hypothetical protein